MNRCIFEMVSLKFKLSCRGLPAGSIVGSISNRLKDGSLDATSSGVSSKN